MEIIPVIDLLHEVVVHARRGDRQHYQPIRSALAPSPTPMAVVDAIMGLYPFTTLYIADLNAIQASGRHDATVSQIRQRHPQLRLWLDPGLTSIEDLVPWLAMDIDLVVGSESLASMNAYQSLKTALGSRMVLSLDFDANGFRGPAELLEQPLQWPRRIIVMTLAKVGSAEGPDMARLHQILGKYVDGAVYAAGGVRDRSDLTQLQIDGVQGALVASAIHDGSLFGIGTSSMHLAG